ncbi:hypothetical protein JO972_10865 [Verrucomicrobiaceae bacterium 5K15]|uniref:AB hydrolase-1 domain-containing protein n=1 Tax=Oceaniferula flava TaxID=2800421 RepID=A0AAE2V8F0_9BACT|nr:hypothetical protein [Oceaniferula flavus]MBK1855462.1 hypothetical protein [Oceaniferula flavus]MBM1136768.1 hypothetical protein [Oceaniferula flavus]
MTSRCAVRIFLFITLPLAWSACSPSVTEHEVTPAKNGEYVILLHGLARSPQSMEPLAQALQEEGYGTCNTGYPSTKRTVPELSGTSLREAVAKCRQLGARKIHFIGHSMGAMLARYHLVVEPPKEAGRLIQLAPPNQGSEVVDNLVDRPIFKAVNGPAGSTLGTDPRSLAAKLPALTHETLIIAGRRSVNPINSLMIPGPDDGKVSVENTKATGMKRHIVLACSHPVIMKKRRTIEECIRFLQGG